VCEATQSSDPLPEFESTYVTEGGENGPPGTPEEFIPFVPVTIRVSAASDSEPPPPQAWKIVTRTAAARTRSLTFHRSEAESSRASRSASFIAAV
jgi:hypothetical protein